MFARGVGGVGGWKPPLAHNLEQHRGNHDGRPSSAEAV